MNKMLITSAGLAEIVNAEQSGTAPVVLSYVAFGSGQYTATADMTALKSEFKRLDSVAGGAIADNMIHLTVHDNSADAYTVNEVGVFTASGTLFAVYSATTPIMEKSATSESMLAIDITLTDVDPASISFGDTNIILNPATTDAAGIVELATADEAKAGTDTTRAMTPATTKAAIDNENFVRSINYEKAKKDGNIDLGAISTRAVGITSVVDLNDYRTAGLYICNQTVTGRECINNPTGGAFALNVICKYASNPNIVYQYIVGFWDQDVYLRRFYTDSSGSSWTPWKKLSDCLPLTGGIMTGTIRSDLEGLIVGNTDTSAVRISGGTNWNSGASLVVCGKEHETYPGVFRIKASDGTDTHILLGGPDGTLTWGGKNVLNNSFTLASDTGAIILNVGQDYGGAGFRLYGGNHGEGRGRFQLAARTNSTDGMTLEGYPCNDTFFPGQLLWDGNQIVPLVASQKPTSSNNQTWYRKYADGWVEQGGVGQGKITLPVPMADTIYSILAVRHSEQADYITTAIPVSTTQVQINIGGGTAAYWRVCGYAAS